MLISKFFFVYVGFLLFGILLSFFGYRLFKIFLAILGFFIGFLIFYKIGLSLFQKELTAIIIGIIAGSLISITFLLLYFLSIISAGIIFGFFIAYNVLPNGLELVLLVIFYAIFMIAGAIFAFYLQKGAIAISTSFIGAYLITISFLMIFGIVAPVNLKEFIEINSILSLNLKIIIIISTLIIGLLTFSYQVKIIKN